MIQLSLKASVKRAMLIIAKEYYDYGAMWEAVV